MLSVTSNFVADRVLVTQFTGTVVWVILDVTS